MITLSGYPVRAMTLRRPRIGRWSARVQLVDASSFHAESPVNVGVELSDDSNTLDGSVFRSNSTSDVVFVAGGPSTLHDDVIAKSFFDATVKQILADTLADTGTLATSSTPEVTAERIDWTRTRDTSLVGIKVLADSVGASWRLLDDGSVWFGSESYPELEDFDATVLDTDGASGTTLVGVSTINLRPGVTWRGLTVGDVEHSFNDDDSLRTTIWINT